MVCRFIGFRELGLSRIRLRGGFGLVLGFWLEGSKVRDLVHHRPEASACSKRGCSGITCWWLVGNKAMFSLHLSIPLFPPKVP